MKKEKVIGMVRVIAEFIPQGGPKKRMIRTFPLTVAAGWNKILTVSFEAKDQRGTKKWQREFNLIKL